MGYLSIISDGKSITKIGISKESKHIAEYVDSDFHDFEVLIKTKYWLDCYFSGVKPDFDIPLELCGTVFQKMVWELVSNIPYGKVETYGEIAKKIAAARGIKKMSSQAVGGAVGRNPIPIIVPCHRVVGAGGNLTGYGCGLDVKYRLLEIEGFDMSKFYMPV